MLSLLQNIPLTETMLAESVKDIGDESILKYEEEYYKFIELLMGNKSLANIDDNKIERFIISLERDIEGLMYQQSSRICFYAYKNLVAKYESESLISFKRDIRTRMLKLRNTSIVIDNTFFTNSLEDTLFSYRNKLNLLAPPKEYKRQIGVGNLNISAIYLLWVHVKNLRLTSNSTKDWISSYENFLQMHMSVDKELIANMKRLITVLLLFNTKFNSDNILELEENSKKELGMSIIEFANIIIAAGTIPLKKYLPEDVLEKHSDIIDSLKSFDNLRISNKHITDVFDVDNLQVSYKLMNEYFLKVISDYKLVSQNFHELMIVDDTLALMEVFDKQFYNVGFCLNGKALIFRSKILQMIMDFKIKLGN